MYRQGDVLICPIVKIPAQVTEEKVEGPIVLAYGEVTGHSHALWGRARMFRDSGGGFFVSIAAPAEVKHEEHATVHLPAGDYEIIRQREYSPEAIRNVAD